MRLACTALKLAKDKGYDTFHSGNEPHLIAGVGTPALEISRSSPTSRSFIVRSAAGAEPPGRCIVAKSINPKSK